MKVYILGNGSDKIHQWELLTDWDISVVTTPPDGSSPVVGGGSPGGMDFKPDGTRVFFGDFGSDGVHQYDLSTPWDVTTVVDAGFVAVGFVSFQWGVHLSPDGTRMYVSGGYVGQFELATPWDVTTAGPPTWVNILGSYGVSSSGGIEFSPDGTRMYVVDAGRILIGEFLLGTPWDITGTLTLSNELVVAETNPRGVFIRPDGTHLYVIGLTSDRIFDYTLTTPFDLSTATLTAQGPSSLGATEPSPRSVVFESTTIVAPVIGGTWGIETDLGGSLEAVTPSVEGPLSVTADFVGTLGVPVASAIVTFSVEVEVGGVLAGLPETVGVTLGIETDLGAVLDSQVSSLTSGVGVEVELLGAMTTPIVPVLSTSAPLTLVIDFGAVLHHFGLRDLDVRNLQHLKRWTPVESRRVESSLTHTEKKGRSLEFLDRPGQQPPFAEP